VRAHGLLSIPSSMNERKQRRGFFQRTVDRLRSVRRRGARAADALRDEPHDGPHDEEESYERDRQLVDAPVAGSRPQWIAGLEADPRSYGPSSFFDKAKSREPNVGRRNPR
jgi:hypothetical protein